MPRSLANLPYLLTRLTTALTLMPWAGAASALTKPSAERNGAIFVIDRGPRPGLVDPEDNFVDLDVTCGGQTDPVRTRQKAELAAAQPDRLAPVVRQILSDHDLPPFRSNVVDAYRGSSDGPVVLIYPENHLDRDPAAGNVRLHERGTAELFDLTEHLLRQNRSVVNVVEYPFGDVDTGLNVTEASRRRVATSIVLRQRVSLGLAMAQLFRDQIKTVSVDDPSLYIREDAAQLVLEIKKSGAFRPAIYLGMLDARMDQVGMGRFVGDQDVYSYFKNLFDQRESEVVDRRNEICERRSRVMADQTVNALGSASVGYLQIGALHVHGVRARLRELNLSYLVLSP